MERVPHFSFLLNFLLPYMKHQKGSVWQGGYMQNAKVREYMNYPCLGFGYYGDLAIWSISSWLSNPLECCGCLSTWWKRWEKAGRSSPFPPSLTGWHGAILLEKSAGKSVGLSLLLSALLRERAVGRESRHETFAAFKACESKWSPRH